MSAVVPIDKPMAECAAQALALIEAGGVIHQKFTCDQCASRQTVEEPNKFFRTATCEACGYVTDIERKGCGFVLMGRLTPQLGEAILKTKSRR